MIIKSHREGYDMRAKQKQKLRKFTNLQRQSRELEPMKPEETKYIQELLERLTMKTFHELQEEFTTPIYLRRFSLCRAAVVSRMLLDEPLADRHEDCQQ